MKMRRSRPFLADALIYHKTNCSGNSGLAPFTLDDLGFRGTVRTLTPGCFLKTRSLLAVTELYLNEPGTGVEMAVLMLCQKVQYCRHDLWHSHGAVISFAGDDAQIHSAASVSLHVRLLGVEEFQEGEQRLLDVQHV